MGQRGAKKDKSIRKLTKMGGGHSFGVTIPIAIVRKLKWRERQKLTVKLRGTKLTIEDWKK
jgi:antitoxin component of MazEF toxin-antitoxin module